MVDQTLIAAFDEIYYSTNKKVLVYITSKCGNPDDISDIFQETYAEIFFVLCKRGVGYIENREAFAFKIARHKIHKHYTLFEKIKLSISMTTKNEDEPEFDIVDFENSNFNLEDKIVTAYYLEEVNAYLKQKSDIIRKIFYLYYNLELTIPQIAKQFGLTESNVKNKLYRTLAELRNKFVT